MIFFTIKRWCVSAVSTRQNQIIDAMKKPVLAMIPLLDMCNHDSENDQVYYHYLLLCLMKINCLKMKIQFSTDYDDVREVALCLAAKDLAQGDEVL